MLIGAWRAWLQEATFAIKTNDPAGFNLIDVFAW